MSSAPTRRALLRLAGASCLAAAASAAVRAEGSLVPGSAGPSHAHATPIRIGAVGLKVRDIERVSAYYRDVIGLAVLTRDKSSVTLGAGGVPLLTLEAHPQAALERPTTAGLFHTAFLMPSRSDLARWLVHVARNRTPLTGFADHSVSEAVYLQDPEGNGIEVYADRPPERWRWEAGSVVMGTYQLDVDDLLSLTDTRASNYAGTPDGLRIGHIHLRVGDVAAGDRFYRDLVGLEATRRSDSASFLSSGRYHHHLAMNIWNSAGAGVRSEADTGLSWFSLQVAREDLLAAQQERLGKSGVAAASVPSGIESRDPWGTRVRLLRA